MPQLPTHLHTPLNLSFLVLGGAMLVRILHFMHATLPLFLHVMPSEDGATSRVERAMRALRHLIVASWIGFPLIWLAAALGTTSPAQEAFITSANDIFAKVSATLALQYGRLASFTIEERTHQQSMLHASQAMVRGFKMVRESRAALLQLDSNRLNSTQSSELNSILWKF